MTLAIAQPLAVGIYRDLPDSDYHALPHCSKHALDVILEHSPMHRRYRLDNPESPTPAMVFGSAFHCRLLTPDRFADDVRVVERCAATLSKGGQCKNAGKYFADDNRWYCGTHAQDDAIESVAITADQVGQIENMVAAIERHRAAAALLKPEHADDANEIAAIFDRTDAIDGYKLRCKLKADGIRRGWGCAFDIKTCESAAYAAFERSIGTYGYHRQAAFYLDGLRAVGIELTDFVIVAVEKSAPYGVQCFRLKGDAIEAGREELKPLLHTFASCERSGVWHGFEQEFRDISIPAWKFKQIVQQV